MAGQRLPITTLRQMGVAPQFGQPLGLGGDTSARCNRPTSSSASASTTLAWISSNSWTVVPSCGRRGEARILDEMAQIERFANRLPSMIVDPDADPTAAAQHLPRRNGEVGAASLRAAIDVLEQIGEAHGRRRLRLVDRHVLPGAQRGARIERCGHADVGGEPRRETGAMPASKKRFAPVRAIVHHHSRQCLKHDLGAFPGGERAVMAKGRDPRRDAARVDRRDCRGIETAGRSTTSAAAQSRENAWLPVGVSPSRQTEALPVLRWWNSSDQPGRSVDIGSAFRSSEPWGGSRSVTSAP